MSYLFYTKQFMKCPFCNDGEVIVDLVGKKIPAKKEVICQDCRTAMVVTLSGIGEFKVEKKETTRVASYVLLQFDPRLVKEPLYVVIEDDYFFDLSESKSDVFENFRFNIEERTCPTNLVGGPSVIYGIPDDGNHCGYDTDPHGMFRFVYAAPKEEVINEISYEDIDNLQNHETAQIVEYLVKKSIEQPIN